jgi:sucrose-6-phosphate hydrolase SacC (GH32 family)
MQTISRIARSTVVALATALLAACGVAAAETGSTPSNMDFETGDLSGWTVVSGDAWASTSVSDATTYWGGPFGQHGRFHLWGFAAGGDDATGVLRSSTFCLNTDAISFLIAGGNDTDRLYVALVRASDDTILVKQTGHEDEAYVRVTWDISAWRGQQVYLRVVDEAKGGWGHINLDDVRLTDARRADNGLTYTRLGQAGQPPPGSAPDRQLYGADALRPQYHYTPYQGWINDPNGLIQWRGRHQLFSQFNPVTPKWGPMHWAHADSPDGVRWHNQPVALNPPPPATPGDISGVFSGSAVDDNGVLTLVYTIFTDPTAHPGTTKETVGIATSTDGVTFTPYAGNPVIAAPPPGSETGFRDPKVFRDPTDGRWKLVIGSGQNAHGRVQLYASADLRHWDYVGVAAEGDGSTGEMWECPDLFPLGDSWVLVFSANSTVYYQVGSFDGTRFTPRTQGRVDAGPDFYAAQHYRDDRGRDLLVGWMDHWGAKEPTRLGGWAGAQTVLRQLFLRSDGTLGSKPVDELDSLHDRPAGSKNDLRVTGGTTPRLATGDALDVSVTLDVAQATATTGGLRLRASDAEAAVVRYEMATHTLTLDTTAAGYASPGVGQAVVPPGKDGKLRLRILVDRSSVEVFTDDGTVLTARVYPRYEQSTAVEAFAAGGELRLHKVQAWRMGSAWSDR